MYIFELVFKIKDLITKPKPKPLVEEEDKIEEENCEHVFLPVDSTKRVLACTKCGLLKRNDF